MPTTTYLGLTYPALSNAPNVPQDMQTLASGVDSKLVGVITCTSGTRPTVRDGAVIFETDTKRYMAYSSAATAWVCIGSNEVLFARKTADQSVTSSTTLTNDNHLAVSVQANAVYDLRLLITYDGSTSGDLKIQFNVPASAVLVGQAHAPVSTAASQQDYQDFSISAGITINYGVLGATTVGSLSGTLVTSGTAGTVQLQWAQLTSNGTATRILTNSTLRLIRVA